MRQFSVILTVAIFAGLLVAAWLWPWGGGDTSATPVAADGPVLPAAEAGGGSLEESLAVLAAAYEKWQRHGMLDAFSLETAVDFNERRRLARQFGAANKAVRLQLEDLGADPRVIRIREMDEQFVVSALALLDHLEATLGSWSYDPRRGQVQFERDEDIEIFNGLIIRINEIQRRQSALIEQAQNDNPP